MNQRNPVQIIIIFLICLSSLLYTALEAKINTDSNTTDTGNTKTSFTIRSEKEFLNAFLKAIKANDRIRMEELVRQTMPHIVYNAAISQLLTGITSVAEGKDGNMYFDTGEAIARIYKRETKQGGLLELVRTYKSYTREMCRDKLRGDDLINAGISLYNKVQLKAALNKFFEALSIFKKIKDLGGQSTTFSKLGHFYRGIGIYAEALNYFKLSLSIYRKIGDMEAEAISLNNIGYAYYKSGNYTEALNSYKLSISKCRSIGDVLGEVRGLIGIGAVYQHSGNYTEALNSYKLSISRCRSIGELKGEAISLGNIGDVYQKLGNYTEALNYSKLSLSISRRIGDVGGEARGLIGIGTVYLDIGNYTKALNYYKLSLSKCRIIGDVKLEANSLLNIGNVYYIFSKYTEALNYYKLSLSRCRSIGEVRGEVNSLVSIGNAYHHLGNYTEALNSYKLSLSRYREIGDVDGEAISLKNIGYTYMELGQYSKAIEILKESIKLSEQLGKIDLTWNAHWILGSALWQSGKGEEAINSYEKAIENIEKLYLFTKGLKQEDRSTMIGERRFVFQEFIELLLELHRKSPKKGYDKKAFTISEKSKSRTFRELMAKSGARTVFAGDKTFQNTVEKERQLIARLSHYRTRLTEELSKSKKKRNDEVLKSIKEQLSIIEQSLNELEKEIESKYPRYADLKRPKSLSVTELQEILKPGETLVAYTVGQDKSAAFVIGQKRFKLVELAIGRKELSESIKKFREGLADVSTLRDLEKFKPEVSYQLYRDIFLPVISELPDIKKLYISADDILYTLPFEALVDRQFDPRAFREARKKGRRGQTAFLGEYAALHYLVDTYTITYLPSASVLRSLRKYRKPGFGRWSKPLIAFADPIFAAEKGVFGTDEEIESKGISKETQLTVEVLTRSTGSGTLQRLKESALEAEAIATELKGNRADIYLREKATEENIHRSQLPAARYLLFSTHGLLGGDFSGIAEPALALTLLDNPPGQDGFLTMSEVLGLDLNAELVILSACNTYGKGDKAGSGEGFAGLTRSFMYAGTRSILVTHWSVESQAARELMVDTFKKLRQESETKPNALREAKLRMRNSIRDNAGTANGKLSLSHPFFWAPFVIVGESK